MGKENKIGLKDFIHQVTDELVEAAEEARLQNRANLGLSRVEIEIATEARREADGTVNIFVLQADGKIANTKTHTVRVELKPYVDDGGNGGEGESQLKVTTVEEALSKSGQRVRRVGIDISRDPIGEGK